MRRWPFVLAGVTAVIAAAVSCIPDVVPSPSALPHCAGFDGGCGSDGTDNCCASDSVHAGMFNLDNTDGGYETNVDEFLLDRYEVTVGRFRAFVTDYDLYKPQAGDGASPSLGPASGWDLAWNAALPADSKAVAASLVCDQNYSTWTDTPGASEDLPINCVSWYLAFAFCAWDGGRLPTEAEWDYAAAGGNDQNLYPWGNTPAPDAMHATFGCPGTPTPCTIPRVGSTPMGAGAFHQQDLAGSMAEWMFDYYGGLPTSCGDACAQLNDAGLGRELRGGDFTHDATELLTTYRVGFPPDQRQDFIGFRCARAQ